MSYTETPVRVSGESNRVFRPSYPEDSCGEPVGQPLHVSPERNMTIFAQIHTVAV